VGEPRPEKVAVVDEVRDRLSSSSAALLTEYRGLKVSDLAALRRAIGDAGGEYKIYKNTLARRAAADLGLTELDAMLVGPTAIAFVSGDAVAVAKSLRDFARGNPNLTIKGGLLGTKVLTAADTTALADVAPREVLLAQLAGALAAPLQQMAGLLQALPRNFAYGLSALVDKRTQAGEGLAAPTGDAETATGDAETTGDAVAETGTGDAETTGDADAETSTGDAVAETSTGDAETTGDAVAESSESAPVESSDQEGDQ
jgi:large subunit ribosomal protein L10